MGADLIGFILAPSKRQVDPAFVRHAPKTRALKVGVVVLEPGQTVPDDIAALVDEGFLDALQFHGKEDPSLVDAWAPRGYKAIGLAGPGSWLNWAAGAAPRVLCDAGTGGTGQLLPDQELEALAASPLGGKRLWLAGGLGPDNVAERIVRWSPELIDASSGLEEKPGRKDPAKIRHFFKEIARVSGTMTADKD
jgi:indole-3-glycerol phosphate synthase/phosphoribosylanthranilate isomerase